MSVRTWLGRKRDRPTLLDAGCGEGGASMGYHRAGFDVYGVDLFRHLDERTGKIVGPMQDRYPFDATQGDAVEFVTEHGHLFDVVAGSPNCQPHSHSRHSHDVEHDDWLPQLRQAMLDTGNPYVIENVPEAPLWAPVVLCGSMFDLVATDVDGGKLWLKRHRLFESNVWMWQIEDRCWLRDTDPTWHCAGVYGGGSLKRDDDSRKTGYTPNKAQAAELLGIDWMGARPMRQAIPPAYTQWVGEQIMEAL